MYPLLILREEIVCLVILVVLALFSRTYRMEKDERVFNLILTSAILHVFMDGFTAWTVNNCPGTALNEVGHWIFFISAILFSTEMFRYVLNSCYPNRKQGWHTALLAVAGIYLLLITGPNITTITERGCPKAQARSSDSRSVLLFSPRRLS